MRFLTSKRTVPLMPEPPNLRTHHAERQGLAMTSWFDEGPIFTDYITESKSHQFWQAALGDTLSRQVRGLNIGDQKGLAQPQGGSTAACSPLDWKL